MHSHTEKTQENKSQSVANAVSKRQGSSESSFKFVDNRPEAIVQRKLQKVANNSTVTSRGSKIFQFNGRFIGDEAAWHLHIDIGNPHLQFGNDKGNRIDIKGTDHGGVYSHDRLNEALNYLLQVIPSDDHKHKYKLKNDGSSGFDNCYNWLCHELGYNPAAERQERFKIQETLDELNERNRQHGRK